MIDNDVAVFIVVFGKGLDLTKKTEKGLINTNQCISFGVQCIDGPTDPTRKLVFYANNLFFPLHMQGDNRLSDSFCPSGDKLRHFPWVFMIEKASCDQSGATYPTISAMSQKIEEEADPVGSRSTQTFSISNEGIETGMNMYNLHSRMVKAVNINQ